MKVFSMKYLVVAALLVIGLSGCSAQGVISDAGVRGYSASYPIYADLSELDDGGYKFANFGFSPDEKARRVNLSDASYYGLSDYKTCMRGLMGVTSASCSEKYQFSRSYMAPGDAAANVFMVPILFIPALFLAEGSEKVLPVFAKAEFDYRDYNRAFMNAQARDGFDKQFRDALARYNRLRGEYTDLAAEALSLEDRLMKDFRSKVSVDVKTYNLSDAVPARHVSRLSSSVLDWKRELSLDVGALVADPFSSDKSFETLGELDHFLDGVEDSLEVNRRELNSAYLTLTPSLKWSIKSSLEKYLLYVRLPAPITEWRGDYQGDHFPVSVVMSFRDEEAIRNNEAAEAMKAANAQRARINNLRSSIGRQYCSDGELSYSGRICSGGLCMDQERTEPGQLLAFLEGVSEDASRIRLRIANWATDTGRLRGHATSTINFTHKPNPLGLGSTFTQRADPGLVFWSSPHSWYPCSR